MGRSSFLVVLLPPLLATCRDFPSGPARGGRASVAVQPTFSAAASLTGFGLSADTVRLVVVRPPGDTLRTLTVYFDPDSAQIHLAVDVVLRAAVETLSVHLELRGGGFALYAGAEPVELRVGRPAAGAPLEIPMTYTGPGSNIAVLTIAPRDTVLTTGDSVRFRVSASDSSGTPVALFYVRWSSSDSTVMRVNAAGLGRAPRARAALSVRVRTPTGITDSTPVTIVPVPTALTLVSGGGQSGVAGAALPQPLRVRVTAADGLGVKGIAVRFAPLAGTGGVVTDSLVVSDTGGYAQTTVALGGVAGPQGFVARALALPQVGFTATALPAAISPATSTITASAATVLSGSGAVLTLVAKDGVGNPLTSGGATVRFLASGGTSTGSIGATIDHGDGTYAATFVGVLAGSGTTIGATIGGVAVTSALPTVAVIPGPISVATSVVTVSAATILSGTATTLTLSAKDAAGNVLTSGGATVAFVAAGGTSSGAIGPTTDHGDGTYTATFTGVLAGTALTIGETVAGSPVASTGSTIAVTPGVASPATSALTSSSGTITLNASTTLTLLARDAAGNRLTSGGLAVAFTASGGTSVGTISATTDHGDGTYTATFTGVVAGTATTIGATIGANPVTSIRPAILVEPIGTLTASSIVSTSASTIASGTVAILTLLARDGAGVPQPGRTVIFSHSGGASTGVISATTDSGNGTYTATFAGVLAGSATTIGATIDGSPVTSTLPVITVLPGAMSTTTSLVTTSAASVLSGTVATLTLHGKDAVGNSLMSGGATVVFTALGGVSTGTIGGTTDNGNGTYTASFTGVVAGAPTTIGATIGGSAVTAPLPTITVLPGAISPATSLVTTSSSSLIAGTTANLQLQARDVAGNDLTAGGSTIAFTTAGGTSAGPISPFPATDHGNGTYSATFTGLTAGTATMVDATVDGKPVTAAAPTITVTPATASRLGFVTQPLDVLAGDTLPAIQVAALDPYGNVDRSFQGPVTLGIDATPSPAAKLQGVTGVAAAAGIATFSDMSVDSAGAGYTLQAVSGSLTAATSAPFGVGGVIAALPVGQGPIAVGVNGKTNRVYVANNGGSSVTVVDGDKLSVITTLSGIELPAGIGVNEETDKIYVSSAGTAALMVIDGATNAILQIPSVGSNPQGVAVDPTSNTVYTAASVGTLLPVPSLVAIDGSKNLVIPTGIVPLPAAGSGVAFNPVDRLVYVALQTRDAVAVVDPAGVKVVTTIPVGRGPSGIAVNPSTGVVYVTNTTEGSLSVIDPAAAREVARIPVGRSPQGLGVDSGGDRIWVANSADATVSLVDGAKRVVVATLVVGPTPTDAGVSPLAGRVFVPVSGQAALKVVRP